MPHKQAAYSDFSPTTPMLLGGVQMGYRTILTLTGSTKREDLESFAYGPDASVDSVADLIDTTSFIEKNLPMNDISPLRQSA
jgi:hypothetical protein